MDNTNEQRGLTSDVAETSAASSMAGSPDDRPEPPTGVELLAALDVIIDRTGLNHHPDLEKFLTKSRAYLADERKRADTTTG